MKEKLRFLKLKFNDMDFRTLLKYPRRLLVVETDGLSLRTVIVRAAKGQIIVEHVVESKKTGFEAAFTETISALKGFTNNLPHQAVLLSHEAIPVLLKLPVDPAKARSLSRLHEMIRWELEPGLAQQVAMRSLGAIMVGRGCLSQEQAREILKKQEVYRNEVMAGGGERRQPLRFGETAIALGLVTQEQLQECLKLQEGFQAGSDEDYVCGWSCQRGENNSAEQGTPFLACGISRSVRDRYARLFKVNGFKLKGIYPLIGCCAAALGQTSLKGVVGVLDIRTGLICAILLSDGAIHDIRLYPIGGEPPSVDASLYLLDEKVDRIYLCGREDILSQLQHEIEGRFKYGVNPIPVSMAGRNMLPGIQASLANITGAARNAFGMPGGKLTVFVPAADPAPPLYKRSDMRWAAAVCASIAVIAGLEIYLSVRMKGSSAAQTELRMQQERVEEEVKRIKGAAEKKDQLTKSLEAKRLELKTLDEQITFFEDVLGRRTQFVTALLDGVARSAVTSGAVIDKISETTERAIEINGWTVSETAAQQFARNLAASMQPWQRIVTDLDIWMKAGRLGIQGYAVSFTLAQKIVAPEKLDKDTQVKTNSLRSAK
ncbi:MAG: hypothetical protein Q8P28_09480 [Deltaproteobacteria bacterium]|nr:hypothetical protein [Deltaproteobacteria bacterium]